MKLFYACVVAALALCLGGQVYATDVVSINVGFNGHLATSNEAGAVLVDNWNDLAETANNPSAAAGTLVNDSGATLPGLAVAFEGNQNTFNWNADPSHTMFSGFLSGLPMSVSLTAVPYPLYDVYVYYNGFGPNTTPLPWEVTDTDTTTLLESAYSARGTVNSMVMYDSTGFVESKYATEVAAQAACDADNGGNYVKFSNLTAANIKIEKLSAGFNEMGFTGIQIVQGIPEPATLGLFAFIGGLFFLRRT